MYQLSTGIKQLHPAQLKQQPLLPTWAIRMNFAVLGFSPTFSDTHQNTAADHFIWLTTAWLLALHISPQGMVGGCHFLNFTPEPKYSLEIIMMLANTWMLQIYSDKA